MPSTYAHYRFGQQIMNLLPQEIQAQIKPYKELFDIGLHGPDILFYYKPLSMNHVNRIGYDLHEEIAIYFFQKAGDLLSMLKERKSYLAYIYGFICHFVLDSQCHGFIDLWEEEAKVSHTEIESEFDRILMEEDGIHPIKHYQAGHIRPTNENATVIAAFFDEITEEEIHKTLKAMLWYNKLLRAPYRAKRWFLYSMLSIAGQYKQLHGLIVNQNANPRCKLSNAKLRMLYENAIRQAGNLICEYESCIDNQRCLSSRYLFTFGSKEQTLEQLKIDVVG